MKGLLKFGSVSLRYTILAKHYQPLMRALYAQGRRITVNENLNFQSDKFSSNESLAEFVHTELKKCGAIVEAPVDSDYMST